MENFFTGCTALLDAAAGGMEANSFAFQDRSEPFSGRWAAEGRAPGGAGFLPGAVLWVGVCAAFDFLSRCMDSRADGLSSIWFRTCFAPAARANRVATPLC